MGRCIFASGSPWPNIEFELNGEKHTVIPAQGNNAYVFPGIALAVIATQALRIPEDLFIVAAKKLSSMVSDDMLAHGTFFPLLKDIRNVSFEIACEVATDIYRLGVASTIEPKDIRQLIALNQFDHERYSRAMRLTFE